MCSEGKPLPSWKRSPCPTCPDHRHSRRKSQMAMWWPRWLSLETYRGGACPRAKESGEEISTKRLGGEPNPEPQLISWDGGRTQIPGQPPPGSRSPHVWLCMEILLGARGPREPRCLVHGRVPSARLVLRKPKVPTVGRTHRSRPPAGTVLPDRRATQHCHRLRGLTAGPPCRHLGDSGRQGRAVAAGNRKGPVP